MDSLLIEGARELYADYLYNLVRESYNKANADYLKKQIATASEYLTEEQKADIREKYKDNSLFSQITL